jgi:hypothetical protein
MFGRTLPYHVATPENLRPDGAYFSGCPPRTAYFPLRPSTVAHAREDGFAGGRVLAFGPLLVVPACNAEETFAESEST